MHLAFANGPDLAMGSKNTSKILALENKPKEGMEDSSIIDGSIEMTKDHLNKPIEFTNIWFSYPGDRKEKWILKEFNLTIQPNESIGLMGTSGVGKSTLFNLLLRFYDPQVGTISIGGIPLKDFTLKSLRANIGLVQQEPLIFNETILNNICYGKPEASVAEIINAAELSNSEEFIGVLKPDESSDISASSCDEDLRYHELGDGYRQL